MTRYVLNSGGIASKLELKEQFHRELVKDLGDAPKFLICSFAQPREYWEERLQDNIQRIKEDMPEGVTPSFTLALPDDFVEQCKAADIIYFNGGDDHLIQYWMNKFDLPQIFRDKVVATNSASSNMLAKHYWTCDWRELGDGLGVLPIKFLAHYQSDFGNDDPRGPIDWQAAHDQLAAYGDTSLPVHALQESQYIVIEQQD